MPGIFFFNFYEPLTPNPEGVKGKEGERAKLDDDITDPVTVICTTPHGPTSYTRKQLWYLIARHLIMSPKSVPSNNNKPLMFRFCERGYGVSAFPL